MAGVGKGDYIAEVAPLSNVVFIHDANINQVKAKLAKAARHKVSAIVSIEPFVYPWRDTRPHSDYKKRLDEFWLALSCNEKKHVAGFYIYDEPYWRNDLTTKIPWQQVKANLEKLIGHLKVLAPGRATSLTLTHFTVNRTNLQDYIPSNLDLFGVNCYLDFGAVCSEPEIVGMFSKMLQAKKPQQKLFMTMDLFSGKPPSASFDLALVQRIRFWKRLMAPHLAEVQALMPFIYQNHPNDNVYGGESLPNSLSETQIYLEAHQGKLKCLGNDLVRIDSKGSIIDRWVNAPMCVPVCEGRDSVRRDALGKEIDRWPSAPHCQ